MTMKTKPQALALLLATFALGAQADAITDWNLKAGDFITEARIGTPPAVRLMALAQTAARDAVEASQTQGASPEAAIAAAQRAVFLKLLPAQQASIESAYANALASIADSPARSQGVAIGERAAAELLSRRLDDGATRPEAYRPHTTPGAYVPTAAAAVPQWAQRKPWLMDDAAQFRPAESPNLTSEQWTRDFNEVKAFGARGSTQRSAEQTEVARFWDYSLPAVYHGVLRSVALQPGRDLARNARLFATSAQAMDDALIAVFDAKYHHGFWRPVTAIRNADTDGNEATERDASWASLIDAPLHPEFPSGHSILASTVATVIEAELGTDPMPTLATSSPTAKGATRQWTRLDDFVREVSDARVWGGIHFRTATQAGEAMGRQIGALAAARLMAMPAGR
jgi:hypothetical protein